jgi:hypothetical protein
MATYRAAVIGTSRMGAFIDSEMSHSHISRFVCCSSFNLHRAERIRNNRLALLLLHSLQTRFRSWS